MGYSGHRVMHIENDIDLCRSSGLDNCKLLVLYYYLYILVGQYVFQGEPVRELTSAIPTPRKY